LGIFYFVFYLDIRREVLCWWIVYEFLSFLGERGDFDALLCRLAGSQSSSSAAVLEPTSSLPENLDFFVHFEGNDLYETNTTKPRIAAIAKYVKRVSESRRFGGSIMSIVEL